MSKTIEEIKTLVDEWNKLQEQNRELYTKAYKLGARPSYGHYYEEFDKVGLLDEFIGIDKAENDLLNSYGLSRYWENFGDDGTQAIFDALNILIYGEVKTYE